MLKLRHLALPLLCAALAGCSDDETEPEGKTCQPASAHAATFNLGLALGFVDAAAERAPLTIQAVAGLDTDILCVQEVWTPEDVSALQGATAGTWPNNIFPAPQPDSNPGEPACTASDQPLLTALRTCVETNCADVCTDQLISCVLTECVTELTAVPGDCQTCLQANVGKPIDDILDACNSGSAAYAYEGAFGIGLLTHYPIVASEEHVFQSTTNRRAVVYAQLDTPLGPLHSFCTHLTAGLSSVEYTGPFGSWEEEQAAQIDDMINFVNEKAGSDGMVLLMGDMNTGPAGENYIAEVPGNFDKFVAAGFRNPYLEATDEPCTFCRTNPLVDGAPDESESVVIDHNLFRNIGGETCGERVLDQPMDVPEYCGAPVSLPPSDHYGVRTGLP